MIQTKNMDITTAKDGLIVHGTNCQGVMGAGVASAIRRTFPEAYEQYMILCGKMRPDELLGWFQPVQVDDGLVVANCFTQLKYGREEGRVYASKDALVQALVQAYEYCIDCDIVTLYAPKIGCGLGGLKWEGEVEKIFKRADRLYGRRVTTIICEYK